MHDGLVAQWASARQTIEGDIEAYTQNIINLKRRLNTLTHIGRLPAEIIAEIFVVIARDAYECAHRDIGPSSRRISLPWIRVTHVCHSWREAALSTPRMWSFICVTRKRTVNVLLERSKQAPLSISAAPASLNDESHKILADVCASQARRIQVLNISGPASIIRQLYDKAMGPSPLLQSLSFSDKNHVFVDNYYPGTEHPLFPHSLSQQQLPRLRNLSLHRLKVGWKNPIYCASLSRLSVRLHAHHDSPTSLGSFDDLVKALGHMTRLEVLELENAIPPADTVPDVTLKPSQQIALPCMRRISLSGTSLDCAHLLAHLNLPIDVCCNISGRSKQCEGIINLAIALQGHLARSKPLRTVRINSSFSVHVSKQIMKAWCSPEKPSFTTSHPLPDSDARLRVELNSPFITPLVGHTTVFAHVHTLEVQDWPRGNWACKKVFAAMPSIVVLSVFGDQTSALTSALLPVRQKTHPETPLILLSKLQILKLSDLRLAERTVEQPSLLAALRDALIARCNYGTPVQELHIATCSNTTASEILLLEEIVPVVQWDGRVYMEEGGDSDDSDYGDYGFKIEDESDSDFE